MQSGWKGQKTWGPNYAESYNSGDLIWSKSATQNVYSRLSVPDAGVFSGLTLVGPHTVRGDGEDNVSVDHIVCTRHLKGKQKHTLDVNFQSGQRQENISLCVFLNKNRLTLLVLVVLLDSSGSWFPRIKNTFIRYNKLCWNSGDSTSRILAHLPYDCLKDHTEHTVVQCDQRSCGHMFGSACLVLCVVNRYVTIFHCLAISTDHFL